MKKISIFGCIAAALLSFVGCEEAGNDYEGTNYIYLESSSGKTTMWVEDENPLTVNVMLTKSLGEDLVLNFVVEGNNGFVELQDNPVTIGAGEKFATIALLPAENAALEGAENLKLTLDAATVLPEKVVLKGGFDFVVRSASVAALTTEQQAIIDAYKQSTGIDISKYLGLVDVNVEYTGYDNENEVPLDPVTFAGKTIITLSDESTAGSPVLKMVANAMGIEDKMYAALRAITVEDSEFWCNSDYYPVNAALMEAIGWNADSPETFSASLDGITINSDMTIDFVGTGVDQFGDAIQIVPFMYDFSAYNRERLIVTDESIGRDENTMDATANPSYHLNHNNISDDEWEGGNWIEASASISSDAMTFTFCLYMSNNDYDYTRVVATYTPNN